MQMHASGCQLQLKNKNKIIFKNNHNMEPCKRIFCTKMWKSLWITPSGVACHILWRDNEDIDPPANCYLFLVTC